MSYSKYGELQLRPCNAFPLGAVSFIWSCRVSGNLVLSLNLQGKLMGIEIHVTLLGFPDLVNLTVGAPWMKTRFIWAILDEHAHITSGSPTVALMCQELASQSAQVFRVDVIGYGLEVRYFCLTSPIPCLAYAGRFSHQRLHQIQRIETKGGKQPSLIAYQENEI